MSFLSTCITSYGYWLSVVSSGRSVVSAVTGQMTYPVASLTLDSARSYVMRGASFTQGTISSIPIGGSISPEGFVSSILLLVVIIVTFVIVVVILVVVVVVIVGVVIVVVIIGVVVVVGDVSPILKLSFVINGFLRGIVFYHCSINLWVMVIASSKFPLFATGVLLIRCFYLYCRSFVSAVTGQMTYPVASPTLDSARSYVMRGASFTQGTISSIPIGGSISPEGFVSSILLLVVIIVTFVIVVVIFVFVVVAIVRVVIVVAIIVVVVVVGDVSPILKLSFVINGWAYASHQDKASSVRVPVANVTLFSSAQSSLDPVFLFVLSVFSMVAACASRAATIPSAISC
nr:hypothetical protein [Tanacetum cinerariifolium]